VRRLALLLALGVVSSPRAPLLLADEPPPVEAGLDAEVDRLLGAVASDDYAVREAARGKLALLARAAKVRLLARKDDPDPEIRRTVAALLASVDAGAEAAPPLADLGEIGLVTLAASGTLREVLARYEASTGARVRVPSALLEARAKVDVAAMPSFAMLDAILEPHDLEVPDGFDEAGQGTASPRGGRPGPPSAVAGPFRCEVESISTTKMLRGGGRPRYVLGLRLAWTPAVQVTAYTQPTGPAAVDDTGATLSSVDAGNTTFGIGGSRRMTTISLTLEAPGTGGVERLASLEVRLRLRIRHGRQSHRFGDLAPEHLPAVASVPAPPGTPGAGASTRLTLESFAPDPDRRGWVLGSLSTILAPGFPPEGLSAALETSEGVLRPMFDHASRIAGANGVVKLSLRAVGSGGDTGPKAIVAAWYTREEEIPVTLVLRGIPLR